MNNGKYVGCSFSVDIAKELIRELFANSICKKQKISETVIGVYLQRGGTQPINSDIVGHALYYMREDGEATNSEKHAPTFGHWAIFSNKAPKNVSPVQQNETIGHGNSSVYVVYFDTFKENALSKGDNRWHCKIGRTSRLDVLERVNDKAFIPETPTTGLVIKTDEPKRLENALHKLLKQFDRHIENAPGKEWFNTSPDEVKVLYEILVENYL